MRSRNRLCIAFSVLAMHLSSLPIRCKSDDSPKPELPSRYHSPVAVFNAFRASVAKRDYRTELLCFTPARRDKRIYEAYVVCGMDGYGEPSPQVAAVLKRHGVDDASSIEAEYVESFQKKHGVDIRLLRRQHQEKIINQYIDELKKNNPELAKSGWLFPGGFYFAGNAPEDEELLHGMVTKRIRDKPGFYDDARKALHRPEDAPPAVGQIRDVRIEGDTATGVVYDKAPINQTGKRKESIAQTNTTFHFRRVQGGWLIEQYDSNGP